MNDELFEVTLTTREVRQILSALYWQTGEDQSLYRRLAQLDPQPIVPLQMAERLAVADALR